MEVRQHERVDDTQEEAKILDIILYLLLQRDGQIKRQIDREIYRQIQRQRDRYREIDRQRDRQRDRQIERYRWVIKIVQIFYIESRASRRWCCLNSVNSRIEQYTLVGCMKFRCYREEGWLQKKKSVPSDKVHTYIWEANTHNKYALWICWDKGRGDNIKDENVVRISKMRMW